MPAEEAQQEKLIPRLRRKYPALDHLVRAKDAFNERYGNHYAAAITYFSVLSLFPLLMVGFSVVGLVVAGDKAVLNDLRARITEAAPSGLGNLLSDIVEYALDARGGVLSFGLVVALYSGIGWMSNLRDALTAQWGQEKKPLPLVSTKLKDLVALAGLGAALLVSFALTALGGSLGKFLLDLAGLDDVGWARLLLKLATIVLSLAANVLVFLWVIARLPRQRVGLRSAVRGAIIAALGFEVLKQVTAIYLGLVSESPVTVLFGPIIGLMFFANLVSRFLLLVTAWTATARENIVHTVEPPPPAVIRPQVRVRRGPGAGAAAGAFGLGALLGWLARRR
ncbi:inner membrane protein YhjD [Amycolatopsis aidingensis]|uniref:inner membrane protein YhjD n=1 Tax=Amycolatopsis aidingensis TaxID=2842453 RepID=UPI001C0CB9CD|nr:inner membrane protein YhjD [Amycolatopsis aidingensis]